MLSAFCTTYISYLIVRCFVGFGFGIVVMLVIVQVAEICPTAYRATAVSVTFVMWAIGLFKFTFYTLKFRKFRTLYRILKTKVSYDLLPVDLVVNIKKYLSQRLRFSLYRGLLHSARSLVSGSEIRMAGGSTLGCNTLCYLVFYTASWGRELQIPRHLKSGFDFKTCLIRIRIF